MRRLWLGLWLGHAKAPPLQVNFFLSISIFLIFHRKCNKCFCWLCSIYLVEPDLVNIEASTEQRVCHDCYVALGGNGKIRMEQFSLPLATITQIERENTDVPLPARQQEVLAQMYLGIIGTGFQENHVRARELFQLAAALGHPSAMCNLGLLYQYGKGIAKDEDKALELFVAAAAKGSNQSKHNAGNLFYERQDYAAAAMYWEGVYESKYNLGKKKNKTTEKRGAKRGEKETEKKNKRYQKKDKRVKETKKKKKNRKKENWFFLSDLIQFFVLFFGFFFYLFFLLLRLFVVSVSFFFDFIIAFFYY